MPRKIRPMRQLLQQNKLGNVIIPAKGDSMALV
jgi:hypothetical protein